MLQFPIKVYHLKKSPEQLLVVLLLSSYINVLSGPKITVHLNQMLALADKKYTIWQQKFNNPKR